MKKIITLTILVTVLTVILARFIFSVIYTLEPITSVGIIVKHPTFNDRWGIETRRNFFDTKSIYLFKQQSYKIQSGGGLKINSLPEKFKIAQSKVKLTYVITDVIGSGDWNVVIGIVNNQIEFSEQ